jgi:hypothetical protein
MVILSMMYRRVGEGADGKAQQQQPDCAEVREAALRRSVRVMVWDQIHDQTVW